MKKGGGEIIVTKYPMYRVYGAEQASLSFVCSVFVYV